MTKRVAGRPRRPTQATGPKPDGVKSRWRWLKNIKAVIIGAGAIAAAASAVVALWPVHDPDDSASVTLRATSGVPVSEYRQHQGGGSPEGAGIVLTTPSQVKKSPTADVSPSAGASTQTKPTSTTRQSATGPIAGTPKSTTSSDAVIPDGRLTLPPGLDEEAVRKTTDKVRRATESTVDFGTFLPIVASNYVDSSGNRVSQDAAIDQVIKILRDARHVQGRNEPLGVAVSADVELSGFRNKTVTLTWSMWQVEGRARIHGRWLNKNLAYELRPTTDHDTTSVDLWIPLPREAGSYAVHVDLYLGVNKVASGESQPFS
jgi:hypothetical protein